jgi:hypothetical protein
MMRQVAFALAVVVSLVFSDIIEEKPIIVENLSLSVRFNGTKQDYYSTGSPQSRGPATSGK